MALRYAEAGVGYLHVLPYEAVRDAFSAVDVCPAHHDAVLDLSVGYVYVVADARVGAYVGVGAEEAKKTIVKIQEDLDR